MVAIDRFSAGSYERRTSSRRDKLSRRGFVGAAAGTAAAATLGPWAPAASGHHGAGGGRLLPRDHIGIQLFTVRDQVASLGFEAVFARLRAIGYREIEFAGYTAQGRRWTNQELRRLLRRYGLRAIGSHVTYFSADPTAYTFVTQLEQVLDDAQEIGIPYVGTPSSPGSRYGETVEGYRRAAEDFNRFGAAARARGMRFYVHPHSGEFLVENGTRLFDVLLANTDPRLVFFDRPLLGLHRPVALSGVQAARVCVGDAGAQPTVPCHYIVERDTAVDPVRNPAGSFATAQRSYDYLARLRERCGGDRRRRGVKRRM